MNIYVMPSEDGQPPRALLFDGDEPDPGAVLATWSRDVGTWMVGYAPLPAELAEAITAHAKDLGVDW